jgi:HSP20 family protein
MTTPVPVRQQAALDFWAPVTMFPSTFSQFERMFEGFNQTWRNALDRDKPLVKMDCIETAGGLELTAELPGMKEKDISVVLSGDTLTISGEKQAERRNKADGHQFVERSYGAFSRSFTLPADIDQTKLKATVADGVLKVVAPRLAKSEPKKIEVQASA